MAGKRGPKLHDLNDVSIFLAKIVREVYRGDLDPKIGGRLAFMCNTLRACLEAGQLERRVEALEALQKADQA